MPQHHFYLSEEHAKRDQGLDPNHPGYDANRELDDDVGSTPEQKADFDRAPERQKNWGITFLAIILGLAIPLFYLGLSLIGAFASNRVAFGAMVAVLVLAIGALVALYYALDRAGKFEEDVDLYATRVNPHEQNIRSIMTRGALACGNTDSLFDAALTMYQNNVGCLVVLNEKDDFIGIVTDRDIVCGGIAHGVDIKSTPITTLMEPNVCSVAPEQSVAHAISVMREHGIRRVPVVEDLDGKIRCVGILSLDDLIVNRVCSTHELAAIVKKQLGEPNIGHNIKPTDDFAA